MAFSDFNAISEVQEKFNIKFPDKKQLCMITVVDGSQANNFVTLRRLEQTK